MSIWDDLVRAECEEGIYDRVPDAPEKQNALKLVVLIEKYFGHTREIAQQVTFECRGEEELDLMADAITQKFQELKQERK